MKSTAKLSFLLLMLCLGSNAPAYCAQEQETPSEVMNLEEAAALLKVDKKELESAAQHGSIPARQIHTEWRFSRSALLGWLSSSSTETVKTTPPKEIPPQTASVPPEAAKEPEITIGKKAEGLTAADIFTHNESVVLERHQWLLDYEQLYSYSKNRGFVSEMDTRTAISTVSVRYGMTDNLQLSAALPYIISSDREFYVDEIVQKNKDEFGAIALQAQQTLLKEKLWIPETTLLIGGEIPLAGTPYQVSLGTVFLKRFDPVILHGRVSYLYIFEPDEAEDAVDESESFVRKDLITAAIGYSLSVNDDVTIGTEITGLFPLQAYSGEDFFQQEEQSYYMRIRCTTALTKSLYIDPSATFNLGGSSDITFGLNFSYSL